MTITDTMATTSGIIAAFARAELLPRRLFLADSLGELTYAETCLRIRKVAGILKRLGLVPGDRVILSSQDERALIILSLALVRCGIAPVLIDAATGLERAQSLISVSRPAAYLVDADLVRTWALEASVPILRIRPERAHGVLDRLLGRSPAPHETYPACLSTLVADTLPEAIDADLDAYVLFTSGTTSLPKGVRITHRSLFAHLKTLGSVYELDEHCRIFNNLNMTAADGIVQAHLLSFVHGITLVRSVPFQLQTLEDHVDALYRHRVTHFITVPTILALLLRYNPDGRSDLGAQDLRMVISCAAPLEVKLWERFERTFRVPVVNVYGLTETVTGGLFAGPGPETRRYGTVGRPVDCEARIIGTDSLVRGDQEPGELQIRGELVMAGYLHSAETTDQVLTADGWFRTGDLASCDPDGCYRILGRIKALIIRGGFNIHPEEVTEVLHLRSEIFEAVTFGVHDPIWGEQVVSAVVCDPQRSLSEAEIIAHCRKHLEEQKIPSRVLIMPDLPRGRSQKVQLEIIRDRAIDLLNRDSITADCDNTGDIESGVLSEAAVAFRVSPDSLHSDMTPEICPGWDSLAHLNFIARLEQRFGILFRTDEILAVKSLRMACGVVKERCSRT